MDPGTLTIIMTVASTAIEAIGSMQQGANEQNAANYNAQVAFNNAAAVRASALEDAKREKRLGLKRQGTNRAHDPNKLDLLEDNAIEEELAFQSIIHSGEVQAIGYDNSGRLEVARGKAAKKAGTMGAFTAAASVSGGPFGYGGNLVPGVGRSLKI